MTTYTNKSSERQKKKNLKVIREIENWGKERN
jgi:hypothetical protein